MTYQQLIETLEIASKYNGGLDHECFEMWAEHDEHGIYFKKTPTAEELRKLSKMGWCLGYSSSYICEEDSEKWEHADSLTNEELIELFESCEKSIYKFE